MTITFRFPAHRKRFDAAICPSTTVAGPIPSPREIPDRVVLRQPDEASRAHLSSRARKRLVGTCA